MEPDHDFLRAWATKQLSSPRSMYRALSDVVESLTATHDPSLPLSVFNGRPSPTRSGYEANIVEWQELQGRRVPLMDLARPARERLLHFLDRPDRAVLWQDALTYPRRPDRALPADPVCRVFYVEPDADTEETFSLLPGPIADERYAQAALVRNPTSQPWKHVGVLLDGVEDAGLPENGEVVDEERIRSLVGHAVGMMLSLGDDGHVFFWRRDCAHMGVPDRTRTEPHATELAWWWQEEET